MKKVLIMRPIVTALISALVLQGCATQGQGGVSSIGESLKQTFNNDDPCANSKRNIGIAAGAITGAVIGAVVSGDKNRGLGVIIGALAGSGIGGLIGHEIDNRQCEISKVQKKYAADIQMTPLTAETPAPIVSQTDTNGKQKALISQPQQNLGLSVSVVDNLEKSQFASNSADLQPGAKAMFSEIAHTYALPKDETNKELAEALKSRHVLLIGHTDDTGNSKLNAELSERRAKVVARLFKDAGVPEGQIFYQGAGETLPIADNSTEEGRTKNRRVEIVDLNDETSFKTYLANRRPDTTFYRPDSNPRQVASEDKRMSREQRSSKSVASTSKPNKSKTGSSVTATAQASSSPTTPSTTVASVAPSAQQKNKVSGKILDFGGKQFSSSAAKVNAGDLVPTSHSFSLISEAQASDIGRIETCNVDRPRNSGLVKSLKDGSEYKTSEFMPGMYGRTWYDMVGGNMVVLNKVSVLREGAVPANKPELKVYSNYKSTGKDPKPDVFLNPDVNTYQTSNGLLYRVFANGDHGVQCMDILIPLENVHTAKDGKLVYGNGAEFVSDFKPKIKN